MNQLRDLTPLLSSMADVQRRCGLTETFWTIEVQLGTQ